MPQRQFRSDDTSKWSEKYGNGSDGDLTVSSPETFSAPNAGCSGSSGSNSLTLDAASTFQDGDLILIHQSRGDDNNPNWELNKIVSGGGTTSLTLKYNLTRTYTNSGASQAQIVGLSQYGDVTIQAGNTVSAPNWDQNKGGIVAYLCKGTFTLNGSISLSGAGYRNNGVGAESTGNQGEGYAGAGTQSRTANGNGGGGGGDFQNTGGGGGGNGAAGSDGAGGPTVRGLGGAAAGNAGLTIAQFGGEGGGGSKGTGANGGNGGSFCLIICKNFVMGGSASLPNNGTNGGAANGSGAGGGAGGSTLIKTQEATLGTNLITATAGSGGSATNSGGNGAVGRIHLDYLNSFTGTTNPTIDTRQDPVLRDATGMFAVL